MSQELDKEALDFVKQKASPPPPYEHMCDFESFNEKLPSKNDFYSLLSHKKIIDKEYQHVLTV